MASRGGGYGRPIHRWGSSALVGGGLGGGGGRNDSGGMLEEAAMGCQREVAVVLTVTVTGMVGTSLSPPTKASGWGNNNARSPERFVQPGRSFHELMMEKS